MIRESKMRRFCNYWMILFNVRSLKPFTQFIKLDEYRQLKLVVTARVNELLKEAEKDNRGKLERCISKISDFSLVTAPLESPTKSQGRPKPRLNKDMLIEAKGVTIPLETKIANS